MVREGIIGENGKRDKEGVFWREVVFRAKMCLQEVIRETRAWSGSITHPPEPLC